MARSRLEIITGPMFSGKTTETLKRLVALGNAGMSVLYMSHSGDTRAAEYVFSTHAETIVRGSDKLPSMSIDLLPDPSTWGCKPPDVIAFDEIHWYRNLSAIHEYIRMGLHVIVCGLHSSEGLKPLGELHSLFPRADSITFLQAHCHVCWEQRREKTDAPFFWRYNPNPHTFVGGSEQYKAVCRLHHPMGA